MNKTSVIKKLKVMFGMEVALAEAKLKDGTVITFDELTEGKEVYVVTEEGNVPAPNGEHELEDGTKITVEDGKITAIIKPEEKTEEVKAEEEKEEVPTASLEERINSVEEVLATLIAKVDELVAKLETPNAEVTEMKTQLSEQKEQIEKLLKAPAVEPAMFRAPEEKPLTADEKRIKAMSLLQKNNN